MSLSPYQRRVLGDAARYGAPQAPTKGLMERTEMLADHLQVHLDDLRRRRLLNGREITRQGRMELNR